MLRAQQAKGDARQLGREMQNSLAKKSRFKRFTMFSQLCENMIDAGLQIDLSKRKKKKKDVKFVPVSLTPNCFISW
jgi:hypothetical protein